MKKILTLACAVALPWSAARAESDNFDAAPVGQPPPGWKVAVTGSGVSKWTVELEATAPSPPAVLKQSGVGTFPVCLREGGELRDGFVEVKFRSVSGREDQAAGVIWRAKDANNYYVCRANALEGNVVLYKTEGGRRTDLPIVGRAAGYGVPAPVEKGRWHTLRVEFAGRRFKASLDGKPLFEVDDGTFTQAGKVGLWTKSDSVMLFDDFRWGAK
ncbi:hypothetical protein AYO41_02375 [Verrucomicrobia bacterium SCGC AG-212-E04]|nr:hypothetical protein AYO41_02375 [Verrucomicrobia bacterium SCGC AG-212-E04]